MDIAALVDEDDFYRSDIRMPETEYLSYRNGMKKGYEDGYGTGFDAGEDQGLQECEEKYRITIPCSVCEKEITLKPGTPAHQKVIEFLRKNGWRHKNH